MIRHALSLLILVAPTFAWSGRTVASAPGPQDVDTPQPAAVEEIDAVALRSRIAELTALEQGAGLTPEQTRELEILREAQAYLDERAVLEARARGFEELARTVSDERLAQREAFLAASIDDQLSQPDPEQTIEDLQSQLESARTRLQSERDLRDQVDSDETERQRRRGEIPAEQASATERLEQIRAELAAAPKPDEPPLVSRASRWRLLAEHALREAVRATVDEELRSYDALRPLVEKRRAYRDRKIEIESRNILLLEDAINERRVELADAARAEAEQAVRKAVNAHEVVQRILVRNEELARLRADIASWQDRDSRERGQIERLLADWSTAFARSEQRVDRVGSTKAIGLHLRSQSSRLPDIRDHQRRMKEREDRINDLVNDSEDWSLELEALTDVDVVTDRKIDESARPETDAEETELRSAVREALVQQRRYLEGLITVSNSYFDDTLLDLQNAEGQLVERLGAYRVFIEERVLWIQSTEPLHWSDGRRAGRAIVPLVAPSTWTEIAADVRTDAVSNPTPYALVGAVILLLLLARPRLRRVIVALAARARKGATDRFALTVAAMVATTLLAAVAPVSLGLIAWRISVASGQAGTGEAVAAGLARAAVIFFAVEVVRHLCRPDGLGDAHFHWRTHNLRLVRRHLRWLVPIVLPLAFVISFTGGSEVDHDSLGRLAFMAAMIAVSLFIWPILRPPTGILREFLARRRGGWIDRLAFLWFPALLLGPIALAILAAAGFFYTALRLEHELLDLTWLVLAILIGHAVLLRWLFLVQRRLALEQAKRRLAAQAKALADEHAKTVSDTATPGVERQPPAAGTAGEPRHQSLPEREEIDVAAVSAQTRRLLNAAVVFALVIGSAGSTFDVLPAFHLFRQVELWSVDEAAAAGDEAATDGAVADVAETPAGMPQAPAAITLADLVYALLLLVITFFLSTNLPGLLEITVLQHLPITPSGRYALTTVVRYVLVIVGVAMAFNAIGIGWSKVQFLAAAITVGLGFGLQEIFANFVSGLILLFERPIRVGDTVTVGGVAGTVSRIRMRATTIIDWDRKELVIPNKEFVTGQIVNWTLSDQILRVVIPVGIAYGSDTQLAEEILYRVADEDPAVLADPKPTVVFTGFGESSLDFVLRVFIPDIAQLFDARHRLHKSIDQAFRTAGIVIAFPQRDVHMQAVAPPPAGASGGPDVAGSESSSATSS